MQEELVGAVGIPTAMLEQCSMHVEVCHMLDSLFLGAATLHSLVRGRQVLFFCFCRSHAVGCFMPKCPRCITLLLEAIEWEGILLCSAGCKAPVHPLPNNHGIKHKA